MVMVLRINEREIRENGRSYGNSEGGVRSMTRILSIMLIITIILVLFSFKDVKAQAKWKQYHQDEYETFYYDQNSIVRPSKDRVKVWVKSIYKRETKSLEEELKIAEVERAKIEAKLKKMLLETDDPHERSIIELAFRKLHGWPRSKDPGLDPLFYEKGPEGEAVYRAIKMEIILYEMDCSQRTYRKLEGAGYDKKGEFLKRYIVFSDWKEIEPEGEKATLYKGVCR